MNRQNFSMIRLAFVAAMALGLLPGCGSETSDSQLNDWVLNDGYYYKVDTTTSPATISQGVCKSDAGAPVDVSFEGCKAELSKKDYSQFKTWIAKEITESLTKLNANKTDLSAKFDQLNAHKLKISDLLVKRTSFASAISSAEAQLQKIDALIEKNPLDSDLIAQRDIVFKRQQENEKVHGAIKSEIFKLKGEIISAHENIDSVDDDMNQLTAQIELTTKLQAENQLALDKTMEEESLLQDTLAKLEGQGIPYETKQAAELYKKYYGVVSRFPAFFDHQNGSGSDYAFIFYDEVVSSTNFGEFTLKSVNDGNFLEQLTKGLSTLSIQNVQNIDGFSVNGKFYNIANSNSYTVSTLAAAIQRALSK